MKKLSASSLVLWALLSLSLIVLILFYCVGFGIQDTFNGEQYTAPQNTGLLIVWMYIMVILCVGSVFGFAIYKVIYNAKHKASVKIKAIDWAGPTLLATLVIIVISMLCASSTPIRIGGDILVDNTFDLKLTDTCLYSIYVLLIAAVLATGAAMTGLFKSKK